MQRHVEAVKFSVVKDLTGHGVGKIYKKIRFCLIGNKGDEPLLKEGMVIAIEPMVTIGKSAVELGLDGFVYQTKDKV